MENVRADLAPGKTLRAGLNFSNFLLTGRDAAGNPKGIAVDIAREIGRRLDLPVEFVAYDSPGKLADAATSGRWDIGFLGAEPARAGEIAFTAAYLEIEASYLVPPGSPLLRIADVDREGIRISVSARSAYDLYLSRHLRHAQLIRSDGLDASFERFVGDKLDALAGLRPRLVQDAAKIPGSRILDGRFTAVQQAIGTPKSRTAAAAWLRAFVEEAKSSGFVAEVIRRNGVSGVSVAGPAEPQ
jgi:polar amino acid transport system substrate-binding protein